MRIILALLAAAGPQDKAPKPDDEGFIRDWLVLAPIKLENESSGAEEIDKPQIKDEGKVAPKAGDSATAGGKEFVWKKYRSPEYFVDFNVYLQKKDDEKEEDAVAYLVTYVICAEEVNGLKLKMGSNDQGKVYVNGKEKVKFSETRTLEKDQDIAQNVSLHKGSNTIVFKCINEKNNWQACLRFTDKDDKPLTSYKISLAPPKE